MGVSTLPGQTALARMPAEAKSTAIDRVSPMSACLLTV
jgi:hypothetical protein